MTVRLGADAGPMVKMRDGIRRNWLFFVVLGGPTALFLAWPDLLGGVMFQPSPLRRLLVVVALAVAATSLALLIAVAVRKTSDGGLVLLVVGCAAAAITMAGHGLLSNGAGVETPWTERLPLLSVAVYAIALALASEPSGVMIHWANCYRRGILVGTVSLFVVPIGLLVVDPLRFGSIIYLWEPNVRTAATATVVTLLASAAWGQWRRWRMGGQLIMLALAGSASMAMATTLSLRFSGRWDLSWWDSHIFLLVGLVGVAGAALGQTYMSSQSGVALERALTDDPLVHISAGHPEALHALVGAVEVKDPYTHGHSVRLADLTVRLGVRLGLSADQLRILARGALLHDVGKINVSRKLLNKSGDFDRYERMIVEQHPEVGAEMVRSVPRLLDTVDVVLHHHERWDGSGYPDGLMGTQIPQLARICAVADVWDALTTDRAYRRGWDPDAALAHLTENAGRLFDPDVVEVMVDYAREELGHLVLVRVGAPRRERVRAPHLL